MRIVAGEWRGRTLKSPRGEHVRPTRDRIREAWMSIVQALIPGARVVDLCAGSGALGLEALSRGAAFAEFVDTDPRSIALVKENIATLGAGTRCDVHRGDAVRFVSALPELAVDLAFADPPYASDVGRRLAEQWDAVPYAACLCIEHDSKTPMPPGGETRRYGSSSITFYHANRRDLRREL